MQQNSCAERLRFLHVSGLKLSSAAAETISLLEETVLRGSNVEPTVPSLTSEELSGFT